MKQCSIQSEYMKTMSDTGLRSERTSPPVPGYIYLQYWLTSPTNRKLERRAAAQQIQNRVDSNFQIEVKKSQDSLEICILCQSQILPMNQNLNRNKNSEFSYSPHPLDGLLSHQLFRLCYQPRSDLLLYNIGCPNTFYKYFFRSLIFILIAAFLPRFCSDRLIYPYLSNKQEISENKKRVTFCVKWPGQGREIDLMVNSKCKKIYTKTEVTLCHLGQY